MGRSGAGSGGGGFSGGSGGFSGGGRASGGFSGGSRSGGRSSAPRSVGTGPVPGGMGPVFRPRRAGYGGFPGAMLGGMIGSSLGRDRRTYVPPQPTPPTGGSNGSSGPDGPQGPGPNRRESGCGCGTIFVIVCAVLLVVALAFAFGCVPSGSSGASSTYYAAQSTHQRTAVPAGTAQAGGLYADEDGDWIHNSSVLEKGLKAFAAKTGVQPYLYILPNGTTTSTAELTKIANALYDENFSDEGHFVLVFCDNGKGGYNCGYSVGSAARSVMDDEAVQVLAKYLDRNYNDYSLAEEQIFSNAFSSTADEIMADPNAPNPLAVGTCVVLALCLVGGGVYLVVKSRRAKEEEKQKRLDDLLNQPLETFGDQDLEDLEHKYADQTSDPAGDDGDTA